MTRILAISGSLRAASSNTTLLRAAQLLAEPPVAIVLYEELGALPHFNPDLEEHEPAVVTRFREQVRGADAVLISTPEYAHGVPGVLKNALDWLVGGAELLDKPVALLNASPRSTFAQASLTETLTVMSGRVIGSFTAPLQGLKLDAAGIAADFADVLREAIAATARASHPPESHA